MNLQKEFEKIIGDLKSLQLKVHMKSNKCKRVNFDTESKFKEFLNENFEFTNDKNDFILCSEFTIFCLRHYLEPLTAKQIECMMNQIIESKNKRFKNKQYKVKFGIKPKKLGFEFSSVRNC
tara:strand:+ start:1084 stop:1446 length:363 start_codon:yes stop_codon:yes gene_type:complete